MIQKKSIYDMPVSKLGLGKRIESGLQRNGTRSIGQLLDVIDEQRLYTLRNIGDKSIEKIEKALFEGNYFSQKHESKTEKIISEKYFENLEKIKTSINDFLETAECDHAQMLGWKAQAEKGTALICEFETFLEEVAYKYIDKDTFEEMHEKIQEFLYS